MKRKLLILGIVLFLQICLVFSFHAQNSEGAKKAGTDSSKITNIQPDQVYETYEDPPEAPGGTNGAYNYISQNLKYPEEAIKAGVQGTVYISFVVNTDGTLSDVVVKKDMVGKGCAEEAVRVIKSMALWKPGQINGKSVRCRYIVPVKFVLK